MTQTASGNGFFRFGNRLSLYPGFKKLIATPEAVPYCTASVTMLAPACVSAVPTVMITGIAPPVGALHATTMSFTSSVRRCRAR